jgi:hypothetical protein
MRTFFQRLRELGARSIGITLLIISLLYLWPDIQGLPAAYGFEGWAQMMPDRETLSLILLAGALAWIIWMDARPAIAKWRQAQNTSPLMLSHADGPFVFENDVDGHSRVHSLSIENPHVNKSICDVEVHLLRITRKSPKAGGYNELHCMLPLLNTNDYRFDLAPGMKRHVPLYKIKHINEEYRPPDEQLIFGPEGRDATFTPGLYKVDLVVYARDYPALRQSYAVGFDGDGGSMMGPWREGYKWPGPKAHIKLSEVQKPQSPQDTVTETPPKTPRD